MSNLVTPYPLSMLQVQGLGSMASDRIAFSMHGTRPDRNINQDITDLVDQLHRAYTHASANVISRQLNRERVLGRLIEGGVGYTAHVRSGARGSVAFYAHYTGGVFQTVLLGAESTPPLHGERTWWHDLIRLRLRDILGIS